MNTTKLNAFVSLMKSQLQAYKKEYEKNISVKEQEYSIWTKNYEKLSSDLNSLFNDFPPELCGRLNKIISKTDGKNSGVVNFDKLIYYVNRINDMGIPNHIIQKNPQYCETVFHTIAEEYLNAKKCLEAENKSKRIELKEFEVSNRDKYKELVLKDWDIYWKQNIEAAVQSDLQDILDKNKAN